MRLMMGTSGFGRIRIINILLLLLLLSSSLSLSLLDAEELPQARSFLEHDSLSFFLSFFLSFSFSFSLSLSLSLSLLRVERVCVGERLFLTNCVESESLSSLRK